MVGCSDTLVKTYDQKQAEKYDLIDKMMRVHEPRCEALLGQSFYPVGVYKRVL